MRALLGKRVRCHPHVDGALHSPILKPLASLRAPPRRLPAGRGAATCREQVGPTPLSTLDSLPAAAWAAAQRLAVGFASTACAAALVLTPPALAEGPPTLIRLPASSNPAILAQQRTLVEAWAIIAESFFDANFNHHDWEEELRAHMTAAYQAPVADVASGELERMLRDLGDPYTRHILPQEYTEFRVTSDGEFSGVGLLIANEPVDADHHLRVLEPIKGGPAQRAGVLPGDEVVSINGQNTAGWTVERASQLLRGASGSEVRVSLSRRSDGVPGVPGRPEPRAEETVVKEVRMKRERVVMSALYATALQPSGPSGPRVGYLRLTNFSSNAAEDMRNAIQTLQAEGASSFILDLRSNPGGLVDASVDIARLWLDGQPTVFTVSGRHDEPMAVVTTGSPGLTALTSAPLAVLVNQNSASASEILSGALRDYHRATIVGDHPTYGKGRIQSVFELQDGSALFVTVAKYRTPAGVEIDHKGIQPDRSCSPRLLASAKLASAGLDDEGFMAGLPLGPGSEAMLATQLASDRCVIAAERVLARQQQRTMTAATRGVVSGGLAAVFSSVLAPPLT